MVTVTLDNLDQLTEMYGRRLDFLVKQSTNDAIAQASRTATGKTRGGTLKRGYVPRDVGTLAASLISTLAGSTALTQGEGAYNLVIGNMEAGDVATFAWTTPYARRLHYGDETRQGWHWVTEMVNDWPAIVGNNIRKARAVQ